MAAVVHVDPSSCPVAEARRFRSPYLRINKLRINYRTLGYVFLVVNIKIYLKEVVIEI